MKNRDQLLEMTKQNLTNYALSLNPPLQLDPENDKKGDMVAKILSAQGMSPQLEPTTEPSRRELSAKDLPRLGRLRDMDGTPYNGPWWRVKVLQMKKEDGDVSVTVNGWNKKFQRDVWVYLEEPYVLVLEQAVTRYTVRDPDTKALRTVSLSKYPMSKEGPFTVKPEEQKPAAA